MDDSGGSGWPRVWVEKGSQRTAAAMGLAPRTSSNNLNSLNMSAERAMDVEAQAAEPAAPSHLELLCICINCPYDLLFEMWRRIKMEVVVEWPMLKQRWPIILFGIVMQYVHGIFTQLAHRMHTPAVQPLHDVGFDITPELGPEYHWVSECLFGTMFALFVMWTFSPFFTQHKRFYTAVMWSRILMVLVVCQGLRIITFSVTQLPGPSFHCRAGQDMAIRPWPDHWSGHVVVDVQRAAHKSCGDLLFSSHTIFMLTGLLAFNEYGCWTTIKAIAWVCGAIISCLIIASRKHYTVDVVVAWYTVPLVFYTLHRRWTTRRPMSELLGALGENDEPDPGSSSSNDEEDEEGKAQVYKNGTELGGKQALSYPKGRSASTAKLSAASGLLSGVQQADHHAVEIDSDRPATNSSANRGTSGQHTNTLTRVRNTASALSAAGEGKEGGAHGADAVGSSSERIGGSIGAVLGSGAVQRMGGHSNCAIS